MALLTDRTGLIADGVIRMRDWDPNSYTLGVGTREAFTQAANDALRKAWGFQKWPSLMRTEPRRFRPTWNISTAYRAGQEVWHAGSSAYWTAQTNNTGVEPGSDGATWEQPVEFIPFVQLEQPWETWKIDETGVDLNAFAWEKDPRAHPGLAAIKGCTWWMDSVVLPKDAPALVYVRFMPRCPEIGFTEWVDDADYAAGDVVFRTLKGRSYSALADNNGATPEDSPDTWIEVGVPKFMSAYVRQYVLSQWLTVSEGRYEAEGRAKQMLGEMAEQMFERAGGDGGRARVSVGTRRR